MNLSTIVIPRGRLPRKIPEEDRQHSRLRKMASSSSIPKRDIFELGPNRRRSESRQSVDFNRPQSRSSSEKSNLGWPFSKSDTTKKSSQDEQSGNSSKFRVVGRGGSGSKLRQVSVSNPVVILEADTTSLRPPLESGGAFFRPSGRGGLGSLSTSAPKAIKPIKPPPAIMSLLRGRKKSENQLNEEFLLHKNSSPRRSQSVYYRTKPTQKTITEPEYMDDLSVIYTLEGRSPSIDPDHDKDSNSYEIEEEPRTSSNEHRERSLNKLTRTLGASPSSIIEDKASKSPIFDNFASADSTKPLASKKHRRSKWESFESDAPSSPITFASAPPAPPPKQTPPTGGSQHPLASTSSDDEMDQEITIVSREQDDVSAQSHCSSSPETTSSPMPHLHVSKHSTSDSFSSSDAPSDPNGPVAKSDWLVPLNEVVISIRRTAPTKPQSWTGEWNREMKDVIRDLRRL